MKKRTNKLTAEQIEKYVTYLREQERAENTVQKYKRDLKALRLWLKERTLTKSALVEWKEYLTLHYAAASVNSMLAAVNSWLQFMGWPELAVKPLKIQKKLFCDEDKELTREEYTRLVSAANLMGNERLSLVLQTICATGIRVSELKFITADSVRMGRAAVHNKGKLRTVFLPANLCRLLKNYLHKEKRDKGTVFITRTGRPLDRSNIWRDMKKLCERAKVDQGKVFPHNLRHLFARIYYSAQKDISRLADILGHSDIGTTRPRLAPRHCRNCSSP